MFNLNFWQSNDLVFVKTVIDYSRKRIGWFWVKLILGVNLMLTVWRNGIYGIPDNNYEQVFPQFLKFCLTLGSQTGLFRGTRLFGFIALGNRGALQLETAVSLEEEFGWNFCWAPLRKLEPKKFNRDLAQKWAIRKAQGGKNEKGT